VFCFSETHHLNSFDSKYVKEKYEIEDVFGDKYKTKGRATGGFVVVWKHELGATVTINVVNRFVIQLSLALSGLSYTFFFVYFPPSLFVNEICADFFNLVENNIQNN